MGLEPLVKINLWPVVALLLVCGCSNNSAVDRVVDKKASREKRLAKAETVLSKTPVPRTYVIQGNQLHVIQVPVADSSGFVEMQPCYIWRDAEFKTASLQCPAGSNDSPPLVGGPTEEKPYP